MKHYRVCINVVRCCDVFVDAESAEEAQKEVMDNFRWEEEDPESWCSGHRGTSEIESCVEVDANGNEI